MLANILVDGLVHNVSVDFTLHHCTAIVIFDVPFPTSFRHRWALRETLLPEVLDCIIVCVGQEVMQVDFLGVILKSVHEPGSVSFYLLGGRDRQENNFGKLLGVKGSEDAASKDDGPLVFLLLDNDHGFMHSVHNQPNNVWPGHAWELLSNDVLQID